MLCRCAFCCEVENGLRRKKKRTKRATEPSLESDRENTKRDRSFAPESIIRHVSVLSASFSRALCARVGLEVNQNECRQAGKLSRLKIRKNHALRLRDWVARSRSARRRCERKNIQKTTANAPPISACSTSSSLSLFRTMTCSCDMMECSVGAPSF